ncbi:MAG: hypothetical protein Q7R76_04980 [Candidatus Woesearchaeota archaeon]|nr:hypothetical protein [Candidatus Woesearchaeota archaeon]
MPEDNPLDRFRHRAPAQTAPVAASAPQSETFDYGLRRLLAMYQLQPADARIGFADDKPTELADKSDILKPLAIPFVPLHLTGDKVPLEMVVAEARKHNVVLLLMDHNFTGGNGIQYARDIFYECLDIDAQRYMLPVVFSAVDRATADVELQRQFPFIPFISKNQSEEGIRVAVQRAFIQAVLWRTSRQKYDSLETAFAQIKEDYERLKRQLEPVQQFAEPSKAPKGEMSIYRTPQFAGELTDHLVGNCSYLDDTSVRRIAKSRIKMDWPSELELVDVDSAYHLFMGNAPPKDVSRPYTMLLNDVERIIEQAARDDARAKSRPLPTINNPTVQQYLFQFSSGDSGKTVLGRGNETDLDIVLSVVVAENAASLLAVPNVERAVMRFVSYMTETFAARSKIRQPTEPMSGFRAYEVAVRIPGFYEPTGAASVEVVQTELPSQGAARPQAIGRIELRRSYLGH